RDAEERRSTCDRDRSPFGATPVRWIGARKSSCCAREIGTRSEDEEGFDRGPRQEVWQFEATPCAREEGGEEGREEGDPSDEARIEARRAIAPRNRPSRFSEKVLDPHLRWIHFCHPHRRGPTSLYRPPQ